MSVTLDNFFVKNYNISRSVCYSGVPNLQFGRAENGTLPDLAIALELFRTADIN